MLRSKARFYFQKIKENYLDKAFICSNTFDHEKAIKNYKKLLILENSKEKIEYYLYQILYLLIFTNTESFPTKKYKKLLHKVTSKILKINNIKKKNKDNNQFKNNNIVHVGFICHFFSKRISKNYLWNIFRNLDKNKFKIFIYSDDHKVFGKKLLDDQDWQLFTKENFFYDTSDKNFDSFTKLLSSHNLDILFELNGHTHFSRFKELSQRLANKQVTTWNIRGPSGFDFIDFCLIYRNTDTSEISNLFSEKFINFDGFRPNYLKKYPEVSNEIPACFKKNFITFGYFGATSKITNKIFECWIEILRKVENSKILLKSEIFANQKIKEEIEKKFLLKGIDLGRVIIEKNEDWDNYIKKYKEIDLLFSSFPHNFGTTFVDSLTMGVPVIDLYSKKRLSSQTGKRYLEMIELEEFVVNSYTEYVNKYVELANNKERLLYYKKTLKEKIYKSELNFKNSLNDFEKALEEILK